MCRGGASRLSPLQNDLSGQFHWGSPEVSISGFMSLGRADFPEESLSVSGQEDKDLAANVLGAAWGRRPGCPQPPAQDIQFLCAYTPPSPGTSGSPPVQRPSGSFFPEGKPWTRARVAGGRRGSNKCFCDGPWATSTVLSFTSTPRGTCS